MNGVMPDIDLFTQDFCRRLVHGDDHAPGPSFLSPRTGPGKLIVYLLSLITGLPAAL